MYASTFHLKNVYTYFTSSILLKNVTVVSRQSLFHKAPYQKPYRIKIGGGRRDRTDDPLLAKQVLSQLSYAPLCLPDQSTGLYLGGSGRT